MSRLITRISLLLVGLFVAAGLVFGATQAFGSSMNDFCGDEADGSELGTCPPFNNASCNEACIEEFGTFGACLPTLIDGPCCTCEV